ncbi:MAG: hypothetical protein JXA11_04395 [Phycisphaerae bacterium]|nr:hypothetical protein [Phycisphaerae bacterium]
MSSRMFSTLFIIVLGISPAVHAQAKPAPSLRVWPDRLCYAPGEKASIDVTIRNPTEKPITGVLRARIISRLNHVEFDKKSPITVPPQNHAGETLSWTVPDGSKWGHEVRVELLDTEGKLLLQQTEFFATGNHAWQVGHWTGFCSSGEMPLEDIEKKCVGAVRRWYNTAVDYFSWQESGWETLIPTRETWNTGQTGNPEGIKALQYFIQLCHNQGIEVYSYLQGCSWGSHGLDWVRAHPEFWNFDREGNLYPGKFVYNVEHLEKVRGGDRGGKYQNAFWGNSGTMFNEEIKKELFRQLRGSVELFGWDGFRSDGLPYPQNAWNYKGEYLQPIPDGTSGDDALLEWYQELRDELKKINPNCTLHFNAGAVAYPAGRISRRLMLGKARNSMAMWESGHNVERSGFDLTNLDVFIGYLHKEVDVAREADGYRVVGPNRYGTQMVEAVATACGAKIFYNIHRTQFDKTPYPWRAFTFRFGRYFWDPKLVHVPETQTMIHVKADPGVRWKDFIQKRVEADGTVYYMTHLVNMLQEYQPKRKLSSPPAQTNLEITFSGPDARKIKRIWVLTSDHGTNEMAKELPFQREGETVRATLPELKVWSVLVFEPAQGN